MIHTCELCGNDFLTEADTYVVRPTPTGVKLYCLCQIKGFDEMKGAEKLKEENKKLKSLIKDFVNNGMDFDIATRMEELGIGEK